MKIRRLARVTVAALFAASAILTGTVAAGAASPDPAPVNIRVTSDFPGDGGTPAPAVWQRTNVTPGPGPELTNADLVENPSNLGSKFEVDIDPVAQTISIRHDPTEVGQWLVSHVTLEVSSADYGTAAVALVSDELFIDRPEISFSWDHSASTLFASWEPKTALGGRDIAPEGTTTFSYELPGTSDGDGNDDGATDPSKVRPTKAPAAGMSAPDNGLASAAVIAFALLTGAVLIIRIRTA